jgi:hypothetical protein
MLGEDPKENCLRNSRFQNILIMTPEMKCVPPMNLQLCSCHFEPCYRRSIYAKLLQGTVIYVCLPYCAWHSTILLKLEKEGSDCTNNPMVQT